MKTPTSSNGLLGLSLKEKLKMIGEAARQDKALWDVLVCMRGPDSPSERPSDPWEERERLHEARRARKMKTGAVIRHHAVGEMHAAMTSDKSYVVLPPAEKWDHYDKHIAQAAGALGLKVKIEDVVDPLSSPLPTGSCKVEVKEGGAVPPKTTSAGMSKLASIDNPISFYKTFKDLTPSQAGEVKKLVSSGKTVVQALKMVTIPTQPPPPPQPDGEPPPPPLDVLMLVKFSALPMKFANEYLEKGGDSTDWGKDCYICNSIAKDVYASIYGS